MSLTNEELDQYKEYKSKKTLWQSILCFFGLHNWDGHTDSDYPAPQCWQCKKWHSRKKHESFK